MRNNKAFKAFTMFEIIVVLSLMAVIAAVSIPVAMGVIEARNISEERRYCETIGEAIKRGFPMGGSYDVSTWQSGAGDWAMAGCGASAYPYGDTSFDPRVAPQYSYSAHPVLNQLTTNAWQVKVGRVLGHSLKFDGAGHAFVAKTGSTFIYPSTDQWGVSGNGSFATQVCFNRLGRQRVLMAGPPTVGASVQRFLLISPMVIEDDTGTTLPEYTGFGNATNTAAYQALFEYLWSLDTSVGNVTVAANPTSNTTVDTALASVASAWNATTYGRTNLARLVITRITQEKFTVSVKLPATASSTIIPCIGGFNHAVASGEDQVSTTPTVTFPALHSGAYGIVPGETYGTSGVSGTTIQLGDRVPSGRKVWLVMGTSLTDVGDPTSGGTNYTRLTTSPDTTRYTIVDDMVHEWY